jgi:DNA-binding transcriptional MerR regulator
MMFYSIGEVANMFQVPASTLRYYDREGLFPNVKRSNGGIRVFSEVEVETLKVIECLKSTGMEIKDIKRFLDWCQVGDSTILKRRDMFYERRKIVEKQMEAIRKTMEIIQYKCWYYDTALEAGTEAAPKNMSFDDLPENVRHGKAELERSLSE